MMIFNPQGLFRISPYLFSLLLVTSYSLPVRAEAPSAEGKVLTMTGLKRDSVKLSSEGMKFTGLRRQGMVSTPAEPDKAKQSKDQ